MSIVLKEKVHRDRTKI